MKLYGGNAMAGKHKVDTIILHGSYMTMNYDRQMIADGALAIADGAIVAIGRADQLLQHYEAAEYHDVAGSVVMPGLINGHTHAGMTFLRGVADDLPFRQWLEQIWNLERQLLDDDFVYWSTLLGCCEMLSGGITTFVDSYYYVDAAARAARDLSMRAIIGQTIVDGSVLTAVERWAHAEDLAYATNYIERWHDNQLITPAISPHALYSCSPEKLRQCADLAVRYDLPILLHLAETHRESELILQRYGQRPIPLLAELGLLNKRLIAAHCVHVNVAEIKVLAAAHVNVIHNPSSNLKLGAGIAPLCDMLRADLSLGLGTDSAASNNTLNLWGEMKAAALLQKGLHGSDAIDAYTVVELATIRAAHAIGKEKLIGSLEVGKRADIIVVAQDQLHQLPIYDIPSQLVYASYPADVTMVMIDGRVVMKGGRLMTLRDEGMLREKTELYRERIRQVSIS